MTERRTIDDTRDLLIKTGAEMVESVTPATVGRIELIDVCRRAGMTSVGSAYKIWDSQESYRVDLLRHVLKRFVPGGAAIDLVTAAVAADSSPLPPLPELIRTATDLTAGGQDAKGQDAGVEHFSVYVALWVASATDPALAGDLHDADVELIDAYAALYDVVAVAYQREWIPPYDARLFATMVAALTDGLTVRAAVNPDVADKTIARRFHDDAADTQWSLLASAVLALAETFTRARPTPGPLPDANGN